MTARRERMLSRWCELGTGALTACALTFNKAPPDGLENHVFLFSMCIVAVNAFTVWLAQWCEARNHTKEPHFCPALLKRLKGETAYRKSFNRLVSLGAVAGA